LRNLRDVFYINSFPEKNEVVYYGLEFKEFLKLIPHEIDNILILKGLSSNDYSNKYLLQVADKEGINRMISADPYNWGDFCWVDCKTIESVDSLTPSEVAELLYLGHMLLPLNSAFFEKLQNRYAYLAHDDGWFCRLYCREFDEFGEIISNKIVRMATKTKRSKISQMNSELERQLLSFAEDGLLIDFSDIEQDENGIGIHIFKIGKFLNMDDMYNNLERHKAKASYSATIVYKFYNKKWSIKL
jgi:hypothetical protein